MCRRSYHWNPDFLTKEEKERVLEEYLTNLSANDKKEFAAKYAPNLDNQVTLFTAEVHGIVSELRFNGKSKFKNYVSDLADKKISDLFPNTGYCPQFLNKYTIIKVGLPEKPDFESFIQAGGEPILKRYLTLYFIERYNKKTN